MGKKKNKPQVINNIQELNFEIDYDKLAKAIVKAQIDLSKAREQIENDLLEAKKADIIKQRKEYLKEKDFSYIKNPVWKKIRIFFNQVRVFKRLLFVPKEKIELFSAIDGLICMLTMLIFGFVRLCLYVISIFVLLTPFFGNDIFSSIMFAFVIFIFAQFFRIAQYEVGRIKDSNYVLAVFSGIVSFVALIISLVALFKGVG